MNNQVYGTFCAYVFDTFTFIQLLQKVRKFSYTERSYKGVALLMKKNSLKDTQSAALIQATKLLLFSLPKKERYQLISEVQSNWQVRFTFFRQELEKEIAHSAISLEQLPEIINHVRKNKAEKEKRVKST